MTDSSDRIHQLRENYDRLEGERRWVILTELERIAGREPDRLEPHLDWLFQEYRSVNSETRWKLDRVLQKLIAGRPDLAAQVIDEIPGSILDHDDQSQQTLYDAAEILRSERPDALWEAVALTHFEPLLEGDIETRKRAYRLLGYVGGPSVVDELLASRETEIGDVSMAVDTALETLTRQACEQLRAGDMAVGASESLEKLAGHSPELLEGQVELLYECLSEDSATVAENAAAALSAVCASDSVSTGLDPWQLVGQLDSEPGLPFARVAGGVTAESTAEFDDLVETLVSKAETAPTDSEYNHVLTALAESARLMEADSFPHLKRLLALEDPRTTARHTTYIELLEEIASSIDDSGRVIPELVEALQSESGTVRRNAARGLASVDIYPPPSALEASKDDPDQLVRELVESVTDHSSSTDITPLDFSSETDSRLVGMEATLKYQTEPGRWDPVPIDEYHETLLENVAVTYRSGGSNQIQLPYYEPHAGLLTAIELALQESLSGGGTRVALYTPGTQNQWGTLGDICDAVRQFGLGDGSVSGDALPLDELCRIGRVQNDLINFYAKSAATGNELILTKQLEGLKRIDGPDAVFCNFHARAPESGDEVLETVRATAPDTPVFIQYSYFTKREAVRGWPDYGFPEHVPDGATPAISRFPVRVFNDQGPAVEEHATPTPLHRAGRQLTRLGESRPLIIHEFGDADIIEPLNSVYSDFLDLDESQTSDLAGDIRDRMYGVHRLSVPVDVYNQWVRQEGLSHGRYAPETTTQLLHSLEQKQDSYDLAFVPDYVNTVVDNLETLYETLATTNPKFSFMVEQIDRCLDSQTDLAILFLSGHMQSAFEFGLRTTTAHDPDSLDADGIHLCGPDRIRELPSVDRLILTDDVPAALARYYLAPNADRIDLLDYGDSLASRLTGWIDTEVTTLRQALAVPDGTDWPVAPAISREIHRSPEAEAPSDDTSPVPRPDTPAAPGSGDSIVSSTPGDASTPSKIELSTESGEKFRLESNRSILLYQERGGETDLVWTTAGRLTPGDRFVIIPDGVRRELYEDTLRELYQEEMSELEYIDSLQLWWETMRDIRDGYASTDIIHSLLERHGLDKSHAAVDGWFRAVRAAKTPVDLLEYTELTIGPDSAGDIRIIGETFDRDELVEHAGLIQNVMDRFRQENRERGRKLNRQIISMVEGSSTELSDRVVEHEVTDVDIIK